MPAQMFVDAFGKSPAAEQPTDTSDAETSVHATTTAVMVLQIVQALFMSRMKSRRTSRIVASFEKPREIYIAI